MGLAEEYGRQFVWRDWERVFDALPLQPGDAVLDLGCAVGDQARELMERGARVVGVDLNEELLATARAKGSAEAEFRAADLRTLPDFGRRFDGIWSSFATAYLVALAPILRAWALHLRPGGWIALTEVDDMFGHEPLSSRTRGLLDAYAKDSLAAGRYDFHMGRKLPDHLRAAGFTVTLTFTVADQELSFDGPATDEVIEAWRERLGRMKLLHDACGPAYADVRDEFLACIARPDHRSTAKVCCCIGRKNAS